MPSTRPTATLRASITLDGRLADPAVQLLEGDSVSTVDADRAGQLLAAHEIGELHLTVRPHVDGRQDSPTLSGPVTPEFFPHSLSCRLLDMETRDGECLLRYRVLGRARTRIP